MKEVAQSLALWAILVSLVAFVSKTEARVNILQEASVCSQGRDFTDINTYLCR